MVTRNTITEQIQIAELRYKRCWNLFEQMKSGNFDNDFGSKLIAFQPILAEAMHDLSRLYRRLYQEKEHLISLKGKYKSAWFNKKMRSIAKDMDLTKDIISIGKTIGDAFALFFYQNDGQYLSEHLAHEEIPFSPPGLGGIGELEFIKITQQIHGYMCLYHGITNILRLGDISLIDLNKIKVAGIGEIKTHNHENGQLNLSILISGPELRLGTDFKSKQSQAQSERIPIPTQHKFDDSQLPRIKRQLNTISNSFKRLTSSPDEKMSVEHDGYYKEFNLFVKRIQSHKMYSQKLGNGMVVVGFKIFNKSLYRKHTTSSSVNYSNKMVGIENLVSETIIPNRTDNTIITNTFFYSREGKTRHHPGMSHLVWWPLDIDVIKRIIFKDVFIMTIYNPAHLYRKLESTGYTIVSQDTLPTSAHKQIDKMRFEIGGFDFYFDMIVNNLFTEESILSILNSAEESSKSLPQGTPMKIALYIQQMFGSPRV